ncbi:MAG: hypothetical protein KDI79_13740, partial [Anaerolineae bacterium]|nr:hypothetical protein [Anaerolineae bacterium]
MLCHYCPYGFQAPSPSAQRATTSFPPLLLSPNENLVFTSKLNRGEEKLDRINPIYRTLPLHFKVLWPETGFFSVKKGRFLPQKAINEASKTWFLKKCK